MSHSSADRNPVEQLAEEFADRHRRGERPSLREYTDQYPQWAEEIRDVFPALLLMEQLKPAPGDVTSGYDGGTLPQGNLLERLGDYRILREVGRGGMGIVYEAEQISLGRHVALKVMPSHALLDPLHLQRFQREAKAAGRLHHTNIVPVYGIGEADGLHYFVMQFIQGQGLDQVLEELRALRLNEQTASPQNHDPSRIAQSLLTGCFDPGGVRPPEAVPPETPGQGTLSHSTIHISGQPSPTSLSSGREYWRSVARIGLQVADALGYASSQGILHRDIKPSNLLLDMQGTVWVADFGLAKLCDQGNLTHSGDIVGTLRYLAPERFNGQADVRSDLYALGLTLYELVTLRSAFPEADRNKLIDQVMHDEPRRPRKLAPRVPSDLETIVVKAIARDPARRYQTPSELAADLTRWLTGEPIQARPIRAWERAAKWARRRPAAAALMVVSALAALALVGLGVGLWYNGQLQTALQDAGQQRQEADKQRERVEELQFNIRYVRDMNLAQRAWQDAHVSRVVELLDSWQPAQQGQPDRRGWEWYYLRGLCRQDSRTLESGVKELVTVACSPDGRWLAAASWEKKVHVWAVDGRRRVYTLTSHTAAVHTVAFSPDSRWLASAGNDETVRIWDLSNGKEVRVLRGHPGFAVRCVAYSPDGRQLASASFDRTVKLWDTATGEVVRTFRGHTLPVLSVAFSPDGQQLASAGQDRLVRLWDATTGRPLRAFRGHRQQISSVVFSPDGRTLATGSEDLTARLWNTATGQQAILPGHTAWVYGVAFSPDGRQLATAADDGMVKLWDVAGEQEISTFRGHRSTFVRGVAFSPDGRWLASAGHDGMVKLWDAAGDPQNGRQLGWHTERILRVTFSPDGRRLASASLDRTVRLWEVPGGREIQTLHGHTQEVNRVVFSGDGRRLASASLDRTVKLWDAASGAEIRTLKGHHGGVNAVAFSSDGRWLASAASGEKTVRIWHVDDGQLVQTLVGHTGRVQSVVFSPDGRTLVSGGEDHTVKFWDTEAWRERKTLRGHKEMVTSVAFKPDGRQLASASFDGTLKLWDAASGELLHTFQGHWGNVYEVAFSPDGRRLASGGSDKMVKIWDTISGQEVLTLKGRPVTVYSVAFSPDGRWLAAAGAERVIRLREAPPQKN